MSATESAPDTKGQGLGWEKNQAILRALERGTYFEVLEIIKKSPEPALACEVVVRTIIDFAKEGVLNFDLVSEGLVDSAMHDPDKYAATIGKLLSKALSAPR